MIGRLIWYLDPSSTHQLKKKKVVKVGPPDKNCLDPLMTKISCSDPYGFGLLQVVTGRFDVIHEEEQRHTISHYRQT